MKINNGVNLFWKIVIAIFLVAVVVLAVRFLSGPEDDWLCRNGQWVKHGKPSAPQPTTACGEQKQPDDILVTTPQLNQTVNSPLTVKGQARGNWFFEAVFPIKLLDSKGNVLAQTQAQAQSEWTTDAFVPFTAQLSYSLAATSTGMFLFNNDNPSDLSQNSKEFRLPVIISPSR